MSMEILKELIKKEWGVTLEVIDEDTPLIVLAEEIAMEDMGCTRKEAYGMYIDNQTLHLPGLIAFYIIDELGVNSEKVNAGMTISHIFQLKSSEK